jgi:hypothetical protein
VAGRLNSEWKGTNTRVYAIREYYLAATTDFATLLTAKGLSREEIASAGEERDSGERTMAGEIKRPVHHLTPT